MPIGYSGGGSPLWNKLRACICWFNCCWACGPFWTMIGCLLPPFDNCMPLRTMLLVEADEETGEVPLAGL